MGVNEKVMRLLFSLCISAKTDEAEVANKVKTIMGDCGEEHGARASWLKQNPSWKIDGVNLPLRFCSPSARSPPSWQNVAAD